MLPNFKSILCLNGTLPEQKWFDKYKNLTLVAADGAANALHERKIIPDIIIGDLDSLKNKKSFKSSKIIEYIDQDKTDFEKSIDKIEELDLLPTLIFGISGGEIDHVIYNLNCFIKFSTTKELAFLSYDGKKHQWGMPIKDKLEFATNINQKVSLLAYESCNVSTSGLNWNLNKKELSVHYSSARNFAVSSSVDIKVHKGIILLITENIT